jgi:hypothetical protein
MKTVMGIDIRLVDVTPEMAQRWLNECNTHNRKKSESTIDAYSLDMKRGTWGLNHQGICFDEDGVLIDGQQRLEAIVRSGKTIRMFVFRNMPRNYGENNERSTQDTIDGGRTRTVADRLVLSHGIENAGLKAAVVSVVALICTGTHRRLSTSLVKDIYDMFRSEIDAVIENRGAIAGLTTAPPLGAFAFAARNFKEQIVEFEKGYFTGADLKSGSPILTFRNYMLNRNKTIFRKDYAKRVIIDHALNCLMCHVLQKPLRRLVQTKQGVDFFITKQKKVVADIVELVRL